MDHTYFKERISAYADNALPPYEQMAVGEHLETCDECKVALEKILKLSAWVDAEANLRGDDYFEKQAQKIEKRLGIAQTEVTPVSKQTWQGLGWKLTTVAASIALVGIVVYLSKDSVLQKSEPPALNAPAIQDERKSEITQPSQSVELKSAPPETTGNRPALKEEMTPAISEEKSAVGSTPTKKTTETTEDQNYKTSPQMLAPANVSTDTVSSQVERKPQPMPETKPVSREDVKLESAAGSIVESTAATVKAKRDVISKFSAVDEGSQVSDSFQERPVKRVDDQGISTMDVSITSLPAPKADSLAYWHTIRDSIEKVRQNTGMVGKVISQANRIMAKRSVRNALAESPRQPQLTLAEAYFRIAQLSSDSTEIARATDSLKSIAADTKSPEHAAAKAYLDSLEVK